jgi:hypothetical protein
MVPIRISLPLAAIMSFLIFGLSKYYFSDIYPNNLESDKTRETKSSFRYNHKNGTGHSIFLFGGNILCLCILFFFPEPNTTLFTPWQNFTIVDLIQLAAGVAVSFFMPGYFLLRLLDKHNQLEVTPGVLVAYFFSLTITGLTGFVTGSLALPISTTKLYLLFINSLILMIWFTFWIKGPLDNINNSTRISYVLKHDAIKAKKIIKQNYPTVIIFCSLFSLIILYSYFLYRGTIIGDQWDHHGRALALMSGEFRNISSSGLDEFYPPFFSSLLSAFFSATGISTVNSYVSINFLNIMPVLAFYYFFTRWVSIRYRPASLIACSLFMLTSGFGWLHILDLAASSPITSQLSALEILHEGGIRTFDIRMPTTFINSAHPEFTTGLIIIALPAGLLLLGLIKENRMSNKFRIMVILVTISTLGILAHDEFYLFVIIASISPLIFRIGGSTNILFGSLLLSLAIIVFIDFMLPGSYYVERRILGFPLIGLVSLFVSLMWAINISGVLEKIYHKYIKLRNKGLFRPATKLFQGTSLKLALGIATVSLIVYFYVFTFMVWGQLSVRDVQIQTTSLGQRVVPWYLYPMKLGLVGLLGLIFFISYIFKRFEKELFIFGIIAVVAFFSGPYYDEHRFTKYIMLGLVGYASLLIYKVLGFALHKLRFRALVCSMLIGAVIISSSLSSMMFTAFTALGLDNPTFRPFNMGLNQRHFPSPSEIRFLDYIHNNLSTPKTYNIALLADEYSRDLGFSSKIDAFSDIPSAKLNQSPLTLNSSTLEGFYDLLDYSDTKYIVIPNNSIDEVQSEPTTPVHFALENFPIVYRDLNYTLLSVPSLSPPSSSDDANTALIYQKFDSGFPSPSETKVLSYDKEPFNISQRSDLSSLRERNYDQGTIVLNGEKQGGFTLWSNPISENEKINYIKSKFRIISANQTLNDAGLKFRDENYEYYIVLRNDSLEVEQRTIDYPRKSQILFRQHVARENNVWYDLRVAITNQTLAVYLDGSIWTQVVPSSADQISISKVGARSYRNSVEFQPIIIGHFPEAEAAKKQQYYSHYYPLSAIALSKINYSSFSEGDLSAFSKMSVILPYDPPEMNRTDLDNYLRYVNAGGTLIVIDGDYKSGGIFGQLLEAQAHGTHFSEANGTSAADTTLLSSPLLSLQSTNFSSILQDPILNSSNQQILDSNSMPSDKTVKTLYINNYDQKMSPFSIEKNFGQGKIIFVNAGPYFQSIFQDPQGSFATLKNFTNLLNITAEGHDDDDTNISEIPPTRFIGKIKTFGATVINSSSILPLIGGPFIESDNSSKSVYVEDIDILTNGKEQTSTRDGSKVAVSKGTLENVFLKDLEVKGKYRVTVNSTGFSYLPSLQDSYYDYAGIQITSPFDMIIKLSKGSSAKLVIQENETFKDTVTIDSNNSTSTEIKFDGMRYTSLRPPQLATIILKEPEIRIIDGNMSFSRIYSRNPEDLTKGWAHGDGLQVEGDISIKVDHVDFYDDRNKGSVERQPLTYLSWISIDGNSTLDDSAVKIPGDTTMSSKISGAQVPWRQVLYSDNSGVLVLSIILVASIVWYLFMKKNKKLSKQQPSMK